MKEKVYRYWLCKTPGLGAVKIRALLKEYGSAENLYHASDEQIGKTIEELMEKAREEQEKCCLNSKDAVHLSEHRSSFERCCREYGYLKETETHFLIPEDEEYPKRLLKLHDYPQVLFYRGVLPRADQFSIAIVGARRCSDYGMEVASYLGRQFAMRGACIVSGMAEGSDGAAHRGAIDGIHELRNLQSSNSRDFDMEGSTLAVLGSGVDRCYPRMNMDIYQELSAADPSKNCGGIMSEFPMGTTPVPGNFPMRNRLISAMADILVVVEAKLKSGSLITADQALEQGLDVYAVPGRVTDPLSQGCNNLIAQGAGIINDLDQFIEELCPSSSVMGEENDNIKKNLAIHEKKVYICLDFIPKHIGTILDETGLEMQILLSALQSLQIRGLIKENPKNYYVLKLT